MSIANDRKNFARTICEAAKEYKENLVGRRFLYVFEGRYIEVLFQAKNFRHLTGAASNLSAMSFYQNAVKGRLEGTQIWFDERHPYKLCCRKARHLKDIATMVRSESFLLEEIQTQKTTFKFGTTDLKFTICMDREYDENGIAIGDCYIAKSLRDEDCFPKSNHVYEVNAILSRPNDAKKYTDIVFLDRACQMSDLPHEVKVMLAAQLLQTP